MSIFNGTDQYADITGLNEEIQTWRITLSTDFPSTAGSNRTIADFRFNTGDAELHQGASNDNISSFGNVISKVVDEVAQGAWNPTIAPSGSIVGWRIYNVSSVDSDARLCADNAGGQLLPVGFSLVEVYDDPGTTLIHSFDLSNPSSATVNDSVGSAVLTLVGFTFASASVDDVNTDEIIDDAETGITLTVSDFGGDINEVKLISGTAKTTVLNLSGTGDSYTFDNVDIAALSVTTSGAPLTSASNVVQVEATDGTDTEVLTITSNPKSGWAVQEITSAVKTEGSVFENFVGTIPDTSQVYYPTADNTAVGSTGILTTDSTTDIDMQYWDATLENWQQFTVIIGSADASTSLPGLKIDYFRVGLSISDGNLNDNEAAFYKQELSVSSGALNDLRVAYFKSITGLSSGTIQDLEMAYYHTEGAVTSTVLQDAAKAFYRIKLGV